MFHGDQSFTEVPDITFSQLFTNNPGRTPFLNDDFLDRICFRDIIFFWSGIIICIKHWEQLFALFVLVSVPKSSDWTQLFLHGQTSDPWGRLNTGVWQTGLCSAWNVSFCGLALGTAAHHWVKRANEADLSRTDGKLPPFHLLLAKCTSSIYRQVFFLFFFLKFW